MNARVLARPVVEYSMRDVSGEVIPFKSRQRVPQHSPSAAWLEESWADKNLPWMRLAVVMLGKDDAEIEAAIGKLALAEGDDGSLICIIKRWRDVKRDLDQMRDALNVALNRSLVALERMDREPDARSWAAGFAAGVRGLSCRCPPDAHRLSWHVAYLAGAAERKRAPQGGHQHRGSRNLRQTDEGQPIGPASGVVFSRSPGTMVGSPRYWSGPGYGDV